MSMISLEILLKSVSMMASVRMSKMQVLRVKMIIIFFQKLSCTNQVFSRENIDSETYSSPIEIILYCYNEGWSHENTPPLTAL